MAIDYDDLVIRGLFYSRVASNWSQKYTLKRFLNIGSSETEVNTHDRSCTVLNGLYLMQVNHAGERVLVVHLYLQERNWKQNVARKSSPEANHMRKYDVTNFEVQRMIFIFQIKNKNEYTQTYGFRG